MAQRRQEEKIVYVGDSRVRANRQPMYPRDYSAYPGKSEAFVPNFLLKEWMVGVVFMVGVLALVISEPAPLGYPADPTKTDFIPMPDWYFLFLYQFLKYPYASNEYIVLGTVVVPGLMFGGLMLAPFLDTGKERRFYRRPIASALMLLTVAAITYLTAFAWTTYKQDLEEKGLVPEHIKREEERMAGRIPDERPNTGTSKLPPLVAADDPGAEVYARANCLNCHQANLTGMAGYAPALLGVGDRYSKEEIMDIIVNGKGNMSPQYEENIKKGLTDEDMEQLVNWLAMQKAQ